MQVSDGGEGVLEVGSSLRRSREAQGLTLVDAERGTRVRASYLRALEDERFDDLPGGSYPRVFLRDYANFLGLEADLLLDSLPTPEPEIAPRPEPSPIRPLPWRAAALAALGIAGVAGLALWLASPGGKGTPAGPAPARAAPRAATRPAVVHHVVHRRAASQVAVLRAARGDCWILVRRGGALVWSGMLRQGRTLRLGVAQRLWLRLGAPWNLDVTLAGRRSVRQWPRTPVNVWLWRTALARA